MYPNSIFKLVYTIISFRENVSQATRATYVNNSAETSRDYNNRHVSIMKQPLASLLPVQVCGNLIPVWLLKFGFTQQNEHIHLHMPLRISILKNSGRQSRHTRILQNYGYQCNVMRVINLVTSCTRKLTKSRIKIGLISDGME